MSSEQTMRGILQTRLLTLGWEAETSFEGKGFTGTQPSATTPYQEITTEFASPLDRTLSGSSQYRGTFQVRLLWPVATVKAAGIGAPTARAEAIKAAFPRNLRLTSGAQLVKIAGTPRITRGPVQGDRDVTIVRVPFSDR